MQTHCTPSTLPQLQLHRLLIPPPTLNQTTHHSQPHNHYFLFHHHPLHHRRSITTNEYIVASPFLLPTTSPHYWVPSFNPTTPTNHSPQHHPALLDIQQHPHIPDVFGEKFEKVHPLLASALWHPNHLRTWQEIWKVTVDLKKCIPTPRVPSGIPPFAYLPGRFEEWRAILKVTGDLKNGDDFKSVGRFLKWRTTCVSSVEPNQTMIT